MCMQCKCLFFSAEIRTTRSKFKLPENEAIYMHRWFEQTAQSHRCYATRQATALLLPAELLKCGGRGHSAKLRCLRK